MRRISDREGFQQPFGQHTSIMSAATADESSTLLAEQQTGSASAIRPTKEEDRSRNDPLHQQVRTKDSKMASWRPFSTLTLLTSCECLYHLHPQAHCVRWATAVGTVGTLLVAIALLRHFVWRTTQPGSVPDAWDATPVRVAFIGNSMFYFNDFPRFFQVFASGRHNVVQNSCLQGGGSIPSLWMEGNAMYPQFATPQAILAGTGGDATSNSTTTAVLYDFGACTVPQLLTGSDDRLDDPGYARSSDSNATNLNPCRIDPNYRAYTEATYPHSEPHRWDYVLINDNTKNPARFKERARSLQFLESFYAPLLLETKAIPVFLWTHAYSTDAAVNLTGLEDVANFTSLTRAGYLEYAQRLQNLLPPEQAPRIAQVGLAFLAVYEDDRDTWRSLFHSDHLHASPSGSFLQGLCVYHALFGALPDESSVVRPDRDMPGLWRTARMFQHAWEPPNPFPTRTTAAYLYRIARRVLVEHHTPSGLVDYYREGYASVAAAGTP